jgi:hypothetical protein
MSVSINEHIAPTAAYNKVLHIQHGTKKQFVYGVQGLKKRDDELDIGGKQSFFLDFFVSFFIKKKRKKEY